MSFREVEDKLYFTIKLEHCYMVIYIAAFLGLRFIFLVLKMNPKDAENILYYTHVVITIGDTLLGIVLTVRFIKI